MAPLPGPQQEQNGGVSSKEFQSVGFGKDIKWKKESRYFQVHATYPRVRPEITGVI